MQPLRSPGLDQSDYKKVRLYPPSTGIIKGGLKPTFVHQLFKRVVELVHRGFQ
jgi:hypothetical protein